MRVVIKIGSSTLAHPGGFLNIRRTEELCKVISDLKNAGLEIIMVSSGAIAMGAGKLGLAKRPDDMATKQAAAAVGQCELMYTYDKLFGEHNHTVGQILLTASDVLDEVRLHNFSVTLERLLELGSIPIINENDTIVTDEIKVGDNDQLGAYVAVATHADMLVVLSDIDGLYTENPHDHPDARLVEVVQDVDAYMSLAEGSTSGMGTGGMITKLQAAKLCTSAGIDMVIANGSRPENLYDVVAGGGRGTRFVGCASAAAGRVK